MNDGIRLTVSEEFVWEELFDRFQALQAAGLFNYKYNFDKFFIK
jgi:hypothetical protein